MEQLFHDNIHLRWHSPTQLMKEDRVDNVFTVSVNSSMEVLDACAQVKKKLIFYELTNNTKF